MRTIKASEFKARCLAILDEVERTGEPVIISKRGRAVAELIRPRLARRERFPQDALRGTGRTVGDIIAPALPPEVWEATRGRHR
ncbi:type II toxin-antitoxin system Phd/YefM family antitoxin [Candidatus Binatia bacterium]|jgi:prevent-host-death family protein|nr:type II toxin-antitoxin system Phd/YefM family antitoxin [Candidatus Binatia bacterium]